MDFLKLTKTTIITNKYKIENIQEVNINDLSDEEFEKLINDKKLEMESIHKKINVNINKIRSMIDEKFLSDETLKYLITNKDEPFFTTIIIILFLVVFFIPVFLPISDILLEKKIILTFYGLILFGLAAIVFHIREKKKEAFAEENYNKSQLFKSEFIKLKTNLNTNKHDRNLLNYYVIFLDENNKKRKNKISKELYNEYKINPPHYLYVVKLPKYKSGKFYHSFNISELENVSFLREINKNYVN